MKDIFARATVTGSTLILYGAFATEPAIVTPFEILELNLTFRGSTL